jgi:hypothetical protein
MFYGQDGQELEISFQTNDSLMVPSPFFGTTLILKTSVLARSCKSRFYSATGKS